MLDSPATTAPALHDAHGRVIRDLRLSVTDRCNYRCLYCRTGDTPAGGFRELEPRESERIVELFVGLGIEKVRFTGGEPLLFRGLLDLVRFSAHLETPSGSKLDLALTTNGHLLAEMARDLKAAGLSRVTISLDAVEPEAFARIARVPASAFERVRNGIRAAQDAGLGPVKINCVLLRGYNDDQIEAFAELARSEDLIVRFIEFMPLEEPGALDGAGSGWTANAVVPMAELLERLRRVAELVELPPNHPAETARRFGFADGRGEIGVIAPVSNPFCGQCSRIRVTADGKIRTCLFSVVDHDLLGRMRRGMADEDLREWIGSVVERKEARHHIGEPGFLKPARAMVQIGG
jgi:cyclic pyranopterin phosphate synthase